MVAARVGREAYLVNIGGGAGSKEYEAIGGVFVQWEPGYNRHREESWDGGSDTSDSWVG